MFWGRVQLMLEKVKEYEKGTNDDNHVAAELLSTMQSMAFLAAGGALCGMLAGSVTTVRLPSSAPSAPVICTPLKLLHLDAEDSTQKFRISLSVSDTVVITAQPHALPCKADRLWPEQHTAVGPLSAAAP